MKSILISQFIDDELSLDEKKEFVVNIHDNHGYFHKCMELIDKQIRLKKIFSTQCVEAPEMSFAFKKYSITKIFSVAALILVASGVLLFNVFHKNENLTAHQIEYRFVIYSEKSDDVRLAGSFSDWKPIKMEKIGDTGYWQLYMNLDKGEYRYAFLVDGKSTYDPTSIFVEEDDFGNKNSVLEV